MWQTWYDSSSIKLALGRTRRNDGIITTLEKFDMFALRFKPLLKEPIQVVYNYAMQLSALFSVLAFLSKGLGLVIVTFARNNN